MHLSIIISTLLALHATAAPVDTNSTDPAILPAEIVETTDSNKMVVQEEIIGLTNSLVRTLHEIATADIMAANVPVDFITSAINAGVNEERWVALKLAINRLYQVSNMSHENARSHSMADVLGLHDKGVLDALPDVPSSKGHNKNANNAAPGATNAADTPASHENHPLTRRRLTEWDILGSAALRERCKPFLKHETADQAFESQDPPHECKDLWELQQRIAHESGVLDETGNFDLQAICDPYIVWSTVGDPVRVLLRSAPQVCKDFWAGFRVDELNGNRVVPPYAIDRWPASMPILPRADSSTSTSGPDTPSKDDTAAAEHRLSSEQRPIAPRDWDWDSLFDFDTLQWKCDFWDLFFGRDADKFSAAMPEHCREKWEAEDREHEAEEQFEKEQDERERLEEERERKEEFEEERLEKLKQFEQEELERKKKLEEDQREAQEEFDEDQREAQKDRLEELLEQEEELEKQSDFPIAVEGGSPIMPRTPPKPKAFPSPTPFRALAPRSPAADNDNDNGHVDPHQNERRYSYDSTGDVDWVDPCQLVRRYAWDSTGDHFPPRECFGVPRRQRRQMREQVRREVQALGDSGQIASEKLISEDDVQSLGPDGDKIEVAVEPEYLRQHLQQEEQQEQEEGKSLMRRWVQIPFAGLAPLFIPFLIWKAVYDIQESKAKQPVQLVNDPPVYCFDDKCGPHAANPKRTPDHFFGGAEQSIREICTLFMTDLPPELLGDLDHMLWDTCAAWPFFDALTRTDTQREGWQIKGAAESIKDICSQDMDETYLLPGELGSTVRLLCSVGESPGKRQELTKRDPHQENIPAPPAAAAPESSQPEPEPQPQSPPSPLTVQPRDEGDDTVTMTFLEYQSLLQWAMICLNPRGTFREVPAGLDWFEQDGSITVSKARRALLIQLGACYGEYSKPMNYVAPPRPTEVVDGRHKRERAKDEEAKYLVDAMIDMAGVPEMAKE